MKRFAKVFGTLLVGAAIGAVAHAFYEMEMDAARYY